LGGGGNCGRDGDVAGTILVDLNEKLFYGNKEGPSPIPGGKRDKETTWGRKATSVVIGLSPAL